MFIHLLKLSQSMSDGVTSINQLEENKFEQFLQRILVKLKLKDSEIFTEEEIQKLCKILKTDEESLLLAIKTILYLFKRLLKYIFMPNDLKDNLKSLGLIDTKAEYFLKLWSAETRNTLKELGSEHVDNYGDSFTFSWSLNAELSSNYVKKCKIPKAYLSLSTNNAEIELEFTHPEIYSVFLQFESIQNELDNLM